MDKSKERQEIAEIQCNPDCPMVFADQFVQSILDCFTELEMKLFLAIVQNIESTRICFWKVSDLATQLNVGPREIDHLTDALLRKVIRITGKSKTGEPWFYKCHCVDACSYKKEVLSIQISKEMEPFVIELKKEILDTVGTSSDDNDRTIYLKR